jgi:[protein-PII] uridylyltransferase
MRATPGEPPAVPEAPWTEVPAAAGRPDQLQVEAEPRADGARIRVTSADRVGLMADIAGTFALLRVAVRAARAWTVDGVAVSDWEVDERGLDPAVVAQRLEAVVKGAADPGARVRARVRARSKAVATLPPVVLVHHGASEDATVLEVRTEDTYGVVFLACQALASLDLSVRSAHVSTIGPQAVDVFYLQEPGAGALTDERAASAAHAVRRELERASTLDA